jgi:hypothetical protein
LQIELANQRQIKAENREFEASRGYKVGSRLSWATRKEPVLKKKRKRRISSDHPLGFVSIT